MGQKLSAKLFNGSEGFSNFRVDVRDKGDHYQIDADLPGLHREMIDVTINDGMLTISADMDEESKTEKDDYVINERRTGAYRVLSPSPM